MSIVNNDDIDLTELMTKIVRKAFDSAEKLELPEKFAKYQELQILVRDMAMINQFASALAKGDLTQKLETSGRLAGYLKTIQANNIHLNWQAQMVARGDLTQKVDYMGDLSDSFNSMVDSLAEKDKNFRRIAEVMPILVSIIRRSDEKIIYASKKSYEVFRLTPEEVIGEKVEYLWVNLAERKKYYKILDDYGVVKDFECQFMRKNGDVFWALLNAASIEYQGEKAVLGTVYDIQQRKETEQELKRLATIDTLTGVVNRRFFFELAEKEFRQVLRYKKSVAFLALDIDHFKNVNDNYGHQGGDEVLRAFVQACKEELRETDIFGRIGGEEFSILLLETDQSSARLVAERIRHKIEQMVITFENHAIKITVSIGAAIIDTEDKSLDQVFQRADKALYEAKNSGRNRVSG